MPSPTTPSSAKQSVTSIYALLVVLLAVGVVLTFKAYGRQTTEGS